MSETPERIEREMLEIRRRMSPDMYDLRKHIQSQVVAEQVKQTIRQRLRDAADREKRISKPNSRTSPTPPSVSSPKSAAISQTNEGSSRTALWDPGPPRSFMLLDASGFRGH